MLQALYPNRQDAAPSFAPAEEPSSFGQMLVDAGTALTNPKRTMVESESLIGELVAPESRALTSAAYQFSRLSRFVSSRDASLEDAADQRIDALKKATGVELENPYRKGYFIEARKRVRDRMYDQDYDWHLGIPGAARQIFDERVADLASKNPDKVAGIDLKPIEENAKALASGAEDAMPGARERATAAGVGPVARFIGEIAGSVGAGLRDPVTQMSMVAGPVGAVGKTLLARALSDGGVQGLFNVGLAIYEHPAIAAWREERGRDGGGALPTMAETATAFLAGAIPGAGLRVLFEAIPRLRTTVPEEAIRAGERSQTADEHMLAERPDGVSADDQVAALTQMQRHEADPSHEPPPAVPVIEAYHGSPHDFEAFSLDKIGTGEGAQSYGHGLYFAENKAVAEEYRKNLAPQKPVALPDIEGSPFKNVEVLEPDLEKSNTYQVRILADRDHFLDWDKPLSEQSPEVQAALKRAGYESEVDQRGGQIARELGMTASHYDQVLASQKLREAGIPGVKYLDQGSRPALPGEKITFQYSNGKYHAYDEFGSNVAGPFDTLAEAKEAVNPTKQTSNFVLFDDKLVEITHKNGIPVERDPVKAVEAMRDDPSFAKASAASNDPAMRDAATMSTLSDEAWRAVRTGQASPEHGLIAAEQARNPDDHMPILDRLAAEHPVDSKEARVIAADEVAAQAVKRETYSLEESFAQGADKIPPQEPLPPSVAAAGERPSLLADLVRSCQD